MMRNFYFGSLTVLLLLAAQPLWSLSGLDIMRKNRRLSKPTTSKATVRLTIKHNSRKLNKSFVLYTKKFGNETRSRINFTYPNRIQFLIYSKPDGNTSQWFKTSSGRIRKVAAGDQSASWANSHFFYEDLKTYSLNNYRFVKISDGSFTKQDKSKTKLSCYRVTAYPRRSGAVYSKRVIYIDKKSWQIRRVLFYKNGRHIKTLSNYRFKTVNGIATPQIVYMQPANNNSSYSYLWLQQISFNTPLNNNLFRRSSF